MQLKRWLVLYPWMWSRSVIAGECDDKSMYQFNQEQSVLDLGFLSVGGTSRSGNQSITPPFEVGSAKDLPKRLFMGSLEDSNFELTEEGWSARYTDLDPGSYALLQYDRTRNHLASRFFYEGVEGLSTLGPGGSWKSLHRQMAIGFPANWHDIAQSKLEALYNLRYIREQDEHPTFVGFPDGIFRMIVIPVPTERLCDLVLLLDAINADVTVAAPVHIYATMTESRADYQVGLCPDVPDSPEWLARFQRDATGLPCSELPAYGSVSGSRGSVNLIVSHRRVYLAQISCVFRDLSRVIAHCNRLGLIGKNDSDTVPSLYPDGAEWAAMVIPAGYEHLGLHLEFYDQAKTRRIVYGTILKEEYVNMKYVGVDMSRSDILKGLQTAIMVARDAPVVSSAERRTKLLN